MTGRSTEEYLLFLWGPGRNGKTKFLNALVEMLGDYGRAAPADLLVDRNGDSHPQKLADLFGRRMVTTIEVPGGRMNSELMKQLTGGDILSARRMRENQWQFLPTHTLWMAANHEPVILMRRRRSGSVC